MPEDVVEGESKDSTPTEPKETPATGEKVVPESKYVGVKRMLDKREAELLTTRSELENKLANSQTERDTITTELSTLKEQLEARPSSEEHTKLQEDYNKLKTEADDVRGQSLTLKKQLLQVKYNVDEEDLKDVGETDLGAFEKGLSLAKGRSSSKPDLGGGSQAPSSLTAKEKLVSGFKELHPNN